MLFKEFLDVFNFRYNNKGDLDSQIIRVYNVIPNPEIQPEVNWIELGAYDWGDNSHPPLMYALDGSILGKEIDSISMSPDVNEIYIYLTLPEDLDKPKSME